MRWTRWTMRKHVLGVWEIVFGLKPQRPQRPQRPPLNYTLTITLCHFVSVCIIECHFVSLSVCIT
jgi:hypothetical protein